MMLLTVILNILAITTAIRVPTAWPEYEREISNLKAEKITPSSNFKIINYQETNTEANNDNSEGFYTPKLEHHATDAAYVVSFDQNNRRPSGSNVEFSVINNGKTQGLKETYNSHEPDVHYAVPYFLNNRRSPTLIQGNVASRKNNNNDRGYYNQNIDYNRTSTKTRHNNPKNASFSQPVVYVNFNANFPTSADGWMPIAGQQSPHKVQEVNHVYPHRNPDRKQDQISNRRTNQHRPPLINVRRHYKNPDRLDSQSPSNYQPNLQHYRVRSKNYRDDKIHEPSHNQKIEIQENLEKGVTEKHLRSEHEAPSNIPTKSNYPGEGQWAIRGLKHQPFVSNHKFTYLNDDINKRPEGYETFENAAPEFETQHSKFTQNLQSFPQKHALGQYIDDLNEESKTEDHEEQKDEEEEIEDDDEDADFVPTRTLAQVRKTENVEHLPSSTDDARLREVIKDSKIHTVYTEEGYEDIAYDHAGHEKNAENSEGHVDFKKESEKVKQNIPKGRKLKFQDVNIAKEFENYESPIENGRENSDDEETDAEVSESSYENTSNHQDLKNPNKSKNMKNNNFAALKESKMTEIKNTEDDDMELEITSEIKIMTQPNNVSTSHKFVKIVPKIKNKIITNTKKSSASNPGTLESLKRRKRFVNDIPNIDVERDFLDVLNSKKEDVPLVVTTEKYPYYHIHNTNVLNKNSPLRYAEDMKNIPIKIPGRMTFYEHSKVSECPEIPRNVNPIPERVENAQNKGEEDDESEDVVELPDVPRLRNLGDKIDCLKLKLFGQNPLDSPIFQESVVGPPESIFKELDSLTDRAKIISKKNLQQYKPLEVRSDSFNGEKVLNEAFAISHSLAAAKTSEQHEKNEEQTEDLYSAEIAGDYEDSDYEAVDHKIVLQTTEKAGPKMKDHTSSPITTEEIHNEILPSIKIVKVKSFISEAPIQDQIVQTTEKFISSTAISYNTTSLRPKHIYDQIDLLNTSNAVINKNNLNVNANDADAQKLTQPDTSTVTAKENIETVYERQPKALRKNFNNENITKRFTLTDVQSVTNRRMATGETLPESAALRIQRRRRKRPQRPVMHVFDINRFLPTPLPPLPIYPTTNTILPKYKTLSEVYYKDEIQPNEQLNVFADVINNIKNSPPENLQVDGSENVERVKEYWNVESQKTNGKKIKVPPRKVRIKHNDDTDSNHNSDVVYVTYPATSTTTTAPQRRRKNKYKNHKTNAQVYEEYLQAVKENDSDDHSIGFSHLEITKVPKRTQTARPLLTKTPSQVKEPSDTYISEDTSFYNPVTNEDLASGTVVDEVLGLAPPFSIDFPLTHNPKSNRNPHPIRSLTESSTLNTFLVPGMKPPGKHKPLLYSDFRLVQHNRVRRRNNYHRIRKRSPFKPSYSEIRREKPAQSSSEEKDEVEEEEKEKEVEDDYVPKRNRNFHYDVENHRVVYTNKKEEEEITPEPVAVEEEEEEEEEEGEYLTLVKVTPPKPFVVITTERNGPSFLDYVHQLKNNSNYRVILEPTKKPRVESTTKSDLKVTESSTSKQVETVIPEFLNIVSKLKSRDDYKEIRDKKGKSTTTPASEGEEDVELEEEVEESDSEVRNSPGGSHSYDRSQIFDISEYLPQPKTVIDYSKYKTIERAPVSKRHNFSSRYNSEDDDLPLNNRDTMQVPILSDNVKASSSEEQFENNRRNGGSTRRSGYSSSEEVVEEEVITSTTTEQPEITTVPTKRIRVRGRKRPTTTTSKPTTTTSAVPSRRRSRLRSRPTTTTTEPGLEENYSQTQRIVQRRLPIERLYRQNQKIPRNHRAFYTPIVLEEADFDSRPSVVHRKRKVSRLVTEGVQLPTNTSKQSEGELGKYAEIHPRKSLDVQIFRNYDSNKKHGGNYRREHEDNSPEAIEINSVPPTAYTIEDSKEIRRLSDVVPKPFAFYTDPTLPGSVNQLKEPKAAENLPSDSEESELSSNVHEKTDKDYNEYYDDEVRINFRKNSETVLKKPVYIVKDPSKRLYYYAPVK